METILNLLDRAKWVLNRGTNWKTKQKVKFALRVIYRDNPDASYLNTVHDTISEFAVAKVLFEEGRLK